MCTGNWEEKRLNQKLLVLKYPIFRFLSDIEERKWRYTKNKIENLKNLDAAKIARKNPPIGKQFWQVTIKVDSHRYKEKKSSATLTLWVTVE